MDCNDFYASSPVATKRHVRQKKKGNKAIGSAITAIVISETLEQNLTIIFLVIMVREIPVQTNLSLRRNLNVVIVSPKLKGYCVTNKKQRAIRGLLVRATTLTL